MAIARQHLKSDRILASLIVDGKATGTQLGCGSYGSVEEVSLQLAAVEISLKTCFLCTGRCQWLNMCWKKATWSLT